MSMAHAQEGVETSEVALRTFTRALDNVQHPGELEMLVLDMEDVFGRRPVWTLSFLSEIYQMALRRTKVPTEIKFFGQRLAGAKSEDLKLSDTAAMLARLQVLEAEKARTPGGPYTQVDSQLKMIFLAAGRAYVQSGNRAIDNLYVQGLAQHISLRGGKPFFEAYLARAPKQGARTKDALRRLADVIQAENH